jgi:hypothetical protein
MVLVEYSKRGFDMKFIGAAIMIFSMCGVSLADSNASRFKIERGRIIVAQSYCGMCADSATSCRSGCNGAGTCIQACDDKFRDCRDQNCGQRIR